MKQLNFKEIHKFFTENPDCNYVMNYHTGEVLTQDTIKPGTVIEYAEEYDTQTTIGVYMGPDDIEVLDKYKGRSLINVEIYNKERNLWIPVDNPGNTLLKEMLDHTDIMKENDIIRISDVSGSHCVIDEENGLTDPSGIYIIGINPADFMDAYSEEVVEATYDYGDDDEDDEDLHPLDGCELTFVPASHLVNYIRRYNGLATAAKFVESLED